MKKSKKDGRVNNGGARSISGPKKTKSRVVLSLPVELAAKLNGLADKNNIATEVFAKYFGKE